VRPGLRSSLPLIAGALVSLVGIASWPFTVDDAFITARYAQRIVDGAGYTMRDGPPTDGVTGPLGLVPGLIGALFGDPIFAAKFVGLVCGALAAALAVRWAARRSTASGAVACAIVSVGPVLGAWSIAGLETGIATLAMTIAVLSAIDEQSSRRGAVLPRGVGSLREIAVSRGARCGASIAALAWLRPELAPACLVILAALALHDRRAAWIAASIALIGVISIVAFRVAMFGTPMPLSALAKPGDLALGAGYLGRGAVIALGGGGVIAVIIAARIGREGRVIALALAAHAIAIVLAGGDWMPGFRLFAPVLPAYAIAAALAIVHLGKLRGAILCAGCVVIPALVTVIEIPRIRDAGAARDEGGAALARVLSAHRRVALVDVGYAIYTSGAEPIDLAGITDPEIGALAGDHLDKPIDESWLRAQRPDAIVLHSSRPPIVHDGALRAFAGYPVEQHVARMGFVRAEYEVVEVIPYAPDYFYVVLGPR
jgi:hypothetical protein